MLQYLVVSRDADIDGLVLSADPRTVDRNRHLNVYVRRLHRYVNIPTSCLEEITEEEYEPRGQRAVRDLRY